MTAVGIVTPSTSTRRHGAGVHGTSEALASERHVPSTQPESPPAELHRRGQAAPVNATSASVAAADNRFQSQDHE